MKTVVIIQARMGSSRLPGKVLLPLGNSCELDYVVTRCRLIPEVDEVIVATSVLPGDDPVADWCRRSGVPCFRGSEDDVLSRYYECAKWHGADFVIRVTGDCPFIDYELAGMLVKAMRKNPAELSVVRGELPRGLAAEMITFAALERIHEIGRESRHREHVIYYAHEYPEQFHRNVVEAPAELRHPHLRITLDTVEDYALLSAVAQAFKGRQDVPSREVVQFLLDHPGIARLNSHVKQKPVV